MSVVFDLDGTLIDSEPLWAQAEANVAARGGVEWTQQDAFTYFGRPLPETTQAILDRGLDMTLDAAIDAMIGELASIYRQSVPWLPGAYELLESLASEGTPTALGTQSFRRLATIVQEAAPDGSLTKLVTGDEISRGKPDPEVFLTAAARLGRDPGEIVVVEDSPTGVAAGVAAGAAVLAVPASKEVYAAVEGQTGVSVVRSLEDVSTELLAEVRSGSVIDWWER